MHKTALLGMHIRVNESLESAIDDALEHNLSIMQCFFMNQKTRTPLLLSSKQLIQLKKKVAQLNALFIHASYFINPAHLKKLGQKTIEREAEYATRIGAKGLVLHPGSATRGFSKLEGLQSLANVLNQIHHDYPHLTIILENTAHAGNSIGSDFKDFKTLQSFLKNPHALRYCIDTAHAHAYGYDLSSAESQQTFLELVDETIGLNNVALIHLNEPSHPCGSKIDKHAIIGEGTLGKKALELFVRQPKLAGIPIILELPVIEKERERAIVKHVQEWII